jgi:uncharacterized membrane protein YfhO
MSKTKRSSRAPSQARSSKGSITDVSGQSPIPVALESFFNQKGSYIVLIIIAILTVVIFKDFLLLQKFYLFRDIGSDTITANYPGTYHIADYLRTEGIPRWSFKQGLGQNIFPFSLTDPFTDLLCLFGKNALAGAIVYVEVLKIFCAGFLCFLFLRKISISGIAAVLGALSYAFSGFIILAGAWQVFSTEAVLIIFLLYAFEKLFQDNEWRLFPLAVGLITTFQPVCMFTESVFLLIYAVCRIIETNAVQKKMLTFLGLKIIGLGAIGILGSCFFSIGAIQQMLDSPRVGGDSSFFKVLLSRPIFSLQEEWLNVTAIMRLFSNDLPGNGSHFTGWGNYLEAPLFYCGLVNLLLAPQLFLLPDKRRKIGCAVLLIAFIVPVVFPFFRYAFWAFTGDYYRTYGFFVAIVLILCSIKAFSAFVGPGRVNVPILALTLAMLLIALYYPYPLYKKRPIFSIDESLRMTITVFLFGYTCMIALLRFPKIKTLLSIFILAATSGELTYSAYLTVDTRSVITDEMVKQKIWYNDGTVDAVRYLHSIDKTFFRVHKDYSSGMAMMYSFNDAKVQDFYGLTSYYSFNQKYFIRFLTEMGLIDASDEWQTRWVKPVLTDDRRLHSFVSLKYQLTKKPDLSWTKLGYDSVARVGDVCILKNRFYLPLGFTYDSYIPYKKFHSLPKDRKLILLQKAFVLDSGIAVKEHFPTVSDIDTTEKYHVDKYASDIAKRKQDTLAIDLFRENDIKGTITVADRKLLFLSIPYDKGWRATVDGGPVAPILVNIGFMGLPLKKGTHTVELSFTPPYFFQGLLATIAGIVLYILIILTKLSLERRRPERTGGNMPFVVETDRIF